MSKAIIADGITGTFPSGTPSIDIAELPYYDVRNMAGLAFWGRADNAVANVGGGFVAQMADKRSGSSRLLRQPSGQTAVITPSTTTGFLRNRATLLWDANTDGRMDLSENIMPTTGPWAIYFAAHLLTGGYNRIAGNLSASQMGFNQVTGELRLSVASSGTGASVTAVVSGGAQNRDMLVGIQRRMDGARSRLAIRYRVAGASWVDVPAAAWCTSDGTVSGTERTMGSTLSLGAYTVTASYAFNGRLAQALVFNADVAGTLRDKVEEYLSNYHGIA